MSGKVKTEYLTDEMIRDHLEWLQVGKYKLGEGPRAGLDRREAIRDCINALVPDGRRVVAVWWDAREKVAAAINARSGKERDRE